MNEKKLRKKIIALCRQMNATGLNQGTSGNISVRFKKDMLITPSGIPYDDLKPSDIARMKVDSDEFEWEGPSKPSSEWHFHRALLKAKPDINAVVHTHSMFATVLSIAREDIPACHYMIAAFGGNTVRCAHYETFGTPQLSASMLKAMESRSACLLANHGMIAGGRDLDNAMWAAVELETLAKQYYHAKLAGSLVILPNDEMAIVLERFKTYGQVLKGEKGGSKRTTGNVLDRVADNKQSAALSLTAEKAAKKAASKITKKAASKIAKKTAKKVTKKTAARKVSSRKVSRS